MSMLVCPVCTLWEEVANDAIGIFIQAALPCMIRRGEEDCGLQGIGDVLMRGKLLSVVERDGVHEVRNRLEATHAK
jgi:hypothetical protein